MAVLCPLINSRVTYLDCMECEEKQFCTNQLRKETQAKSEVEQKQMLHKKKVEER